MQVFGFRFLVFGGAFYPYFGTLCTSLDKPTQKPLNFKTLSREPPGPTYIR